MNHVELWLILIGKALLSLLMHPVFYLSLIFLLLVFSFRTRLERAMFSVRLRAWVKPFVYALIGGAIASIAVSIITVLLGFTFSASTVWWLWGVSLVLMLIRLRFAGIVYSASVVTLLHLAAKAVGPLTLNDVVGEIYQSLLELQPVSILVVASLMSLAQSLLVRWQGKHFVSPIYMSGKRGKVIGGYVLQGYWAAPIFLFMPVASDTAGAVSFASQAIQPFFLTAGTGAWLLLACPLLLGVTGMTHSVSPAMLIKRISNQWLVYSVLILTISIASWWVTPLLWVASIGMLLSFELVHWINHWHESKYSPRYGPLDKGLRVLAIVEHSPAVHMGIEAGDTVLKANGKAVNTLDELYEAMSINPAFCKLELLNVNGDVKFAQRARFSDEHHQLGIIMAPDGHAKYLENYREPSLFTLFGHNKLRRQATMSASADIANSL